MDDKLIFSTKELSLLRSFNDHEVQYLIVGLSAAALQGAPVVTQDVDLWIKDIADPKFFEALNAVGATYVPSFGFNPPGIAGEGFGLFDLVLTMHGLKDFDKEYAKSLTLDLLGTAVRVLPLERIIASKKATNRPKDKLVLPVLIDVSKVQRKK